MKGVLPVLIGKLHELAGRRAAGVINHDIDTAEMLRSVVNEFLNIFRLTHVSDDRQHVAASLLTNSFCRFLQRGFPAGADRHLGAFARETERRRFAHALTGTSDQRYFTFESKIHVYFSP